MLQKTYSIYSDDLNDVQLFVEAGKNHIACWCRKQSDDKLRAFEFFQCDDYTAENFEELVDNIRLYSRLLTMPVITTHFFWNTDEVLCLPKEKNDPAFLKDNFQLVMGDSPDTEIFSVATGDCLVAWRLGDQQQNKAQECFRGTDFTHEYNPLLSSLKNRTAVYLFFYPHYFTLVAFKENKLQFTQTRHYTSAEEVLYFILNVQRQYKIDKNTAIFCGGFIEEKSKLYDTLYQYLESLQLMHVNEDCFASDEFKEYASHYFIPYINYVV